MAVKRMAFLSVAPLLSLPLVAAMRKLPINTAMEESGLLQVGLQAKADLRSKAGQVECQGAWCTTVSSFSELFDTNDPASMQLAIDQYAEYAEPTRGIRFAVTKDHYYEMYHGNTKRKMQEYLPQGFFAWNFNNVFENMEPTEANEAAVVQSGTMTVNLGWWRRSLFWQHAVQQLPHGLTFPFSSVTDFDDCHACPSKMMMNLTNRSSQGWKITDITLIKLA